MKIGYARVSTDEQSLALQRDTLTQVVNWAKLRPILR